jgi:aryl sulfotransferase
VFSPQAKYLYIARDGRDVVWSLYNHHANANAGWYAALNDTPGRVGPPIEPPPADIRRYWRDWMDRDGHPFWPFWESVRNWWAIRHLPNVLFVHFTALKRDMPSEMRRIADFLDIPIDEARWQDILTYCSFDWMKRNASQSVPLGGAFWDGGAETFINKGVNGRWIDTLTPEESAEYEARAERELGKDCARWLATGTT